ncbi:DUF6221 family protein [Streptomyces sp. NBC_01594]
MPDTDGAHQPQGRQRSPPSSHATRRDQEIVQTWRYLADHLQTWNPNRVWANVDSRRLIVDLFEIAVTGSPERAALGDAVKALAMAYRDHPEFDPDWLLREW